MSHVTDKKEYRAEIQLRTLLQDVWGELEHKLSYKQSNIHPHIRKSFELLANELENNDALITHLKLISDQEYEGYLYSIQKQEPTHYYGYEDDITPDIFRKDVRFIPLYVEYSTYLKDIFEKFLRNQKINSVIEARKRYHSLTNDITDQHKREDNKIDYFQNMEEAFLLFWEGGDDNLKKALKIYEGMKDNDQYKDRYIIYARMGEIYFCQGNVVKSLSAFDKCEQLLGQTAEYENRLRLKQKIASIYWLLGKDYVSKSLELTKEASDMCRDILQLSTDKNHGLILNNLCAYQLEIYLNTKKQDDYTALKNNLDNLEKFIKDKEISSNVADTLAWTHYHIYRHERNNDELRNAVRYAMMISEKENLSTMKFLSYNIQKNHIQEILNAWHEANVLFQKEKEA